MKSKILLVWLVALFTMPLYMHIPVVGTWLAVLLVAGPMTIPVLKWFFSYHEGAEHHNKPAYSNEQESQSTSYQGAKDYNWWYDRHSRPDRW